MLGRCGELVQTPIVEYFTQTPTLGRPQPDEVVDFVSVQSPVAIIVAGEAILTKAPVSEFLIIHTLAVPSAEKIVLLDRGDLGYKGIT